MLEDEAVIFTSIVAGDLIAPSAGDDRAAVRTFRQ